MKTSFRQYILTAALMASAASMTAQDLNSAYFTDDFKYRHDMNAAYGNEQGYAAIPILGNFGMKVQGNIGVGDVLWKNPDFGVKTGAKKTTTFMHPGISAQDALSKFNTDGNKLLFDMDINIVSVGFRALGGYNTVEIRERVSGGVMLPYELFEMAKDIRNKDYVISDLGVKAQSYTELALGHSRQILDNLRVGAKVKLLLGTGRGELTVDDMKASFQNDAWVLQGKAKAEVNMKGFTYKEEDKEYKSRPGSYRQVNDVDLDGAGISGFGLGVDLGAIYEFKDDIGGAEWLEGLKVSLGLNDLGFISWNNGMVAENNGQAFTFNGFNNIDLKKGDDRNNFGDEADRIADNLTDFIAIRDKGDQGGKTTALAATARLGLEYPLPVYDKVSFGLLGTHRFNGDYSWTEGRLSANYKPLSWLDGGINVAVTNFCTTMGWVINFHPVGMNVFFGADHLMGKTGASSVPLGSNVSFNFGMNVAWGKSKASKRKSSRKKG